jgi:hypothetical protein
MPTRNVSFFYLCILRIVFLNSSKAILFSCTCIPTFSSSFLFHQWKKLVLILKKKLPVISPPLALFIHHKENSNYFKILIRGLEIKFSLSLSLCLSIYLFLLFPHSYCHCIQHCQINCSLITYAEHKLYVIVSFQAYSFLCSKNFYLFHLSATVELVSHDTPLCAGIFFR